MIDREKELKYLIYLKSEALKQLKKELKQLSLELKSLEGEKTLKRKYKK
jgi:hypothetical protein